MEDDLIFLNMEDDLKFWKMEDDLQQIMRPETIKSKNNDCGTAPGNLVPISLIQLNQARHLPSCSEFSHFNLTSNILFKMPSHCSVK